jgi:plastocyanin
MVAVAAACSASAEQPQADDATPAGAVVEAPTGTVITVEMITDGTGNFFKPSEITAKRGDVVRFILTSGVHNVHFVADSNPGVPALPAASAMLQLPGQTYDLPVGFAKGKYYFQCDPHALLGMIGHLTVSE